jgi:1-deoxy-D-xylulose-5-phosphate reductoisomerase
MERRGLAGAAFNAAKETALDGFIAGALGFMDMAEVVEEAMNISNPDHIDAAMTLDNVRRMDHVTRTTTRQIIENRAG